MPRAARFALDHVANMSMLIRDWAGRLANRKVRHEVVGDCRPVLGLLVTDHRLVGIEAIAARPGAA
jgi:hypothetical protein